MNALVCTVGCRNREIVTHSQYFLHHLGAEASIEESKKNLPSDMSKKAALRPHIKP